MSSNWNRRYRANMEKIKSGNIYEVAEVVRNLSLRDREKGLSTGERKMLENARQILLSRVGPGPECHGGTGGRDGGGLLELALRGFEAGVSKPG